jgi:hypothetical protein
VVDFLESGSFSNLVLDRTILKRPRSEDPDNAHQGACFWQATTPANIKPSDSTAAIITSAVPQLRLAIHDAAFRAEC